MLLRGFACRLAVAVSVSCLGMCLGASHGQVREGAPIDLSLKLILAANLMVVGQCLLGLLTGGIASLLTLFGSGFICGAQFVHLGMKHGYWKVLGITLPHGTIEMAGIWLAGTAGLAGLPMLLAALNAAEPREHVMRILKGAFLSGALALGLTVASCVIEWYRIRGM